MSCASVPVGSREFFFVGLRFDGEPLPLDFSGLTVETAVVRGARAPAEDAGADVWATATFDGREIRGLLTGSEERGRYTVWVRITRAPERVLRRAGVLIVG